MSENSCFCLFWAINHDLSVHIVDPSWVCRFHFEWIHFNLQMATWTLFVFISIFIWKPSWQKLTKNQQKVHFTPILSHFWPKERTYVDVHTGFVSAQKLTKNEEKPVFSRVLSTFWWFERTYVEAHLGTWAHIWTWGSFGFQFKLKTFIYKN